MKSYILFGVLFVALLATAIVIIELVRVPDMYAVEGRGSVKYRPDAARISVAAVARADKLRSHGNEFRRAPAHGEGAQMASLLGAQR